MLCSSSDDMQTIVRRLDVHSLGWKTNTQNLNCGCGLNTIFPEGDTWWWKSGRPQSDVHFMHSWGIIKKKKKQDLTNSYEFLTSPSPGLMLVSWTSSRQADWLMRGSDVVLTVWSQMLFKVLDCRGTGTAKWLESWTMKSKTLVNCDQVYFKCRNYMLWLYCHWEDC